MKSYVRQIPGTFQGMLPFTCLLCPSHTGFLVIPPKRPGTLYLKASPLQSFLQPRDIAVLGDELQSRICSLHQPVTLFYIFVSVAQAPLFCNFFIWGLGQGLLKMPLLGLPYVWRHLRLAGLLFPSRLSISILSPSPSSFLSTSPQGP